MSEHIGYLHLGSNKVECCGCGDEIGDPRYEYVQPPGTIETIRLYDVNVGSYRQTCHTCNKVLVAGQPCGSGDKCSQAGTLHSHWCELYPNPAASWERDAHERGQTTYPYR